MTLCIYCQQVERDLVKHPAKGFDLIEKIVVRDSHSGRDIYRTYRCPRCDTIWDEKDQWDLGCGTDYSLMPRKETRQ